LLLYVLYCAYFIFIASSEATVMFIEQFYHDSSSFQLISLADKCADLEFVRNVAADIESKQGRQLRPRVFVEPTASPPGLHYSCSL